MRLLVSTTLLTHQQCEGSDPTKSGGKPPVRFVPEKLEDFDAEKTNTVKIKMDDEVINSYPAIGAYMRQQKPETNRYVSS